MTAPSEPGGITGGRDALDMIRAARGGDMGRAAAVYERSSNPVVLTGALISIILGLAEAAVRQWGGNENVGTYVDALLEETLKGELPAPAADKEQPTVEVVAAAAGPHGPAAWLSEVNVTAAAALLAILDEDSVGLTAVLGTCTREEAISVAATLARGMIACIADEDRPGARDSLQQLLEGLGNGNGYGEGEQPGTELA
jgi:hypothetical protein